MCEGPTHPADESHNQRHNQRELQPHCPVPAGHHASSHAALHCICSAQETSVKQHALRSPVSAGALLASLAGSAQDWSIQVAQYFGAGVGLRQLRKGVPVFPLHQHTLHVEYLHARECSPSCHCAFPLPSPLPDSLSGYFPLKFTKAILGCGIPHEHYSTCREKISSYLRPGMQGTNSILSSCIQQDLQCAGVTTQFKS